MKTYVMETGTYNPYENLSFEEYVFERMNPQNNYFMLWQNEPSIIIGKNQNTFNEIKEDYVRKNNIHVARRLTGGGAVYHDLVNINFTFIADQQSDGMDFAILAEPILQGLRKFGLEVQFSGRNDLLIDGKKFSGNAQYRKNNRVLQHGTLLFDSDMTVLGKALNVSTEKMKAKGVNSVESRVTNIRPYLKKDLTCSEFYCRFLECMIKENYMEPYVFLPNEVDEVMEIANQKYKKEEWNYGLSPSYNHQVKKYFSGCGLIEIYLFVEQELIRQIHFYGDFFGVRDIGLLEKKLIGKKLSRTVLEQELIQEDLNQYFCHLNRMDLIEMMLLKEEDIDGKI